MTTTLAIDIGGSGVKGALVDLGTGELRTERVRVATPQPALPGPVTEAVAEVAALLGERPEAAGMDPVVGVTFPGVVQHGVVRTAPNLDPAWVGVDADGTFEARLGRPVVVINDADAAGVAEVAVGAAKGQRGVVLLLTFGTGIGSAVLHDGVLVPNTELGHLELRGADAEDWAAARLRDELDLSWKAWSKRVQEYLDLVEGALWPDLIVVGGGISAKADKWLPLLRTRTPVVPAALRNSAGIVGAALWAHGRFPGAPPVEDAAGPATS